MVWPFRKSNSNPYTWSIGTRVIVLWEGEKLPGELSDLAPDASIVVRLDAHGGFVAVDADCIQKV